MEHVGSDHFEPRNLIVFLNKSQHIKALASQTTKILTHLAGTKGP